MVASDSVGVVSPVVFVPDDVGVGSLLNVWVTWGGIADATVGAGLVGFVGGSLGAIVPKPPPTLEREPPTGVDTEGAL